MVQLVQTSSQFGQFPNHIIYCSAKAGLPNKSESVGDQTEVLKMAMKADELCKNSW